MPVVSLNVNGHAHKVDADPQTPLLWVLRDEIGLTGTKFGCGMAQCGACTVHVDGQAMRSCVVPAAALAGRKITTIEGVGTRAAKAVQKAWLALDVPQCGYCQSGQIMAAAALLAKNPDPSDRPFHVAPPFAVFGGERPDSAARMSAARCTPARMRW